jgi:hypothetical protein
MTVWEWVFGFVQLGIAGIALFVAWKALVIARDAQRFSERENIRAGNRDRLRRMHEALNQLRPLQDASLAPHEEDYENLQQWLKTCLAVAGARDVLDLTMALASRPIGGDRDDVFEAVQQARQQLLQTLEYEADRAHAGKRLVAVQELA